MKEKMEKLICLLVPIVAILFIFMCLLVDRYPKADNFVKWIGERIHHEKT